MEDFSPLEAIICGLPEAVMLNKKINNYNLKDVLWMHFDAIITYPIKVPHLKKSNNLSTLSVKINVVETWSSRKARNSRHLHKIMNI